MTSLEEQVRSLAERSVDAAERRGVELGSVSYVESQVRRSHRAIAVAAALVVLVAGAVVVAVASDDDAPTRRSVVASTTPLAPLRARLVLPSTHLRAGSQMSGEVVVDNDTGEAIEVIACKGFYAVALVGDDYRQEIGFLDCGERFVVPIGTSRWPVTLSARQSICGGESLVYLRCLPSGGPPPVPKGTYRAEVVDGGAHNVPLPIPDPVTITVE